MESISSKAKKKLFDSKTKKIALIIIFLSVGAFIRSRSFDASSFFRRLGNTRLKFPWARPNLQPKPGPKPIPFVCPTQGPSNTFSSQPLPSPPPNTTSPRPGPLCPDYFRWIHEDLRPWASTGITEEMLGRAAPDAAFRLIIINDRPYVHRYRSVFQTRDIFTIWGFLQLLRRYPGRVPDLDLMFNCEDAPVVQATGGSSPPPLFRYCKDDTTVDIVFPDWSFWGWPEVNIRPWEKFVEELREANGRLPWKKREPYAYWKGNPDVAGTRGDLMKCNENESNLARLFTVDWNTERMQQFKESSLTNQCTYRYKVYIEGASWSVSEKNILGCDSPTLYVESKFQDFVSRGLRPGLHYWPIPQNNKCWAIKQAVQWGNAHPSEVQAIGKEGSSFIHESLHMDYIYEYMLHLLTEYSKLQTFKPTKPEEASEVSMESMVCLTEGKVREFLIESMVMGASESEPCLMPSAFEPDELKQLLLEKENGLKKVIESIMKTSRAGRIDCYEKMIWGLLIGVYLALYASIFQIFI